MKESRIEGVRNAERVESTLLYSIDKFSTDPVSRVAAGFKDPYRNGMISQCYTEREPGEATTND